MSTKSLLARLERAGRWVEDTLLVGLLLGMILLAGAQIIGRNLFGTAFLLGDELLRLMVLWVTLAAAVAASRSDRHISLSLLDRLLHGRWLALSRLTTQLFTAAVCGIVAWYGAAFVHDSYTYGDTLLGRVPAWTLQLVLPLGFGAMSYRHLVLALQQLRGIFAPEPAQ